MAGIVEQLTTLWSFKFDKKSKATINDLETKIRGVRFAFIDAFRWVKRFSLSLLLAKGPMAALFIEAKKFASVMVRTAAALNVSTSSLQEMSFAMRSLGLNQDQIADSLSKLQDRINDAKNGSKTWVRALKQINLTWRDFQGLDPIQSMIKLANASKKLGDRQAVLASTVRIFGDSIGNKLAASFTKGGFELEKFIGIAQRLGIVLTGPELEALKEANAAVASLTTLLRALGRQIAARIAPAITRLANLLLDYVSVNATLIRQRMDQWAQTFADNLENLIQKFTDLDNRIGGVDGWIKLFGDVWDAWKVFAAGMIGFQLGRIILTVGGAIQTLAGIITAALGVALGPAIVIISAFATGLTSIVLAAEDLWVFIRGGDSVLGRLLSRFGDGDSIMDSFANALRSLIVESRDLGIALARLWNVLAPARKIVVGLGIALGKFLITAFIRGITLLLRLVTTFVDFGTIVVDWSTVVIDKVNQVTDALGAMVDVFGSGSFDRAFNLVGKVFTEVSPTGRAAERSLAATVASGPAGPLSPQQAKGRGFDASAIHNSANIASGAIQVTVNGGDPGAVTDAINNGVKETVRQANASFDTGPL